MITPDGYFDWAIRDPGPPEKQYSQRNSVQGVIFHSAVGYYAGWQHRLFNMDRLANGRFTPYAAASVTGMVRYDGTLMQNYPIRASCWASGNRVANTNFDAYETEGGAPGNEHELLRGPQKETQLRIVRETMEYRQLTEVRRITSLAPGSVIPSTIFWLGEHQECVDRWGGAPTACPSSRIPWLEYMPLLALRANGLYLIKSAVADYTFMAFWFQRAWRWKIYVPNQEWLAAVLHDAKPVRVIPRVELEKIPRIA